MYVEVVYLKDKMKFMNRDRYINRKSVTCSEEESNSFFRKAVKMMKEKKIDCLVCLRTDYHFLIKSAALSILLVAIALGGCSKKYKYSKKYQKPKTSMYVLPENLKGKTVKDCYATCETFLTDKFITPRECVVIEFTDGSKIKISYELQSGIFGGREFAIPLDL